MVITIITFFFSAIVAMFLLVAFFWILAILAEAADYLIDQLRSKE